MASWEFKQLGGEEKVLTLDGYAAPFGRPRKEPLYKETIKATIATTHYPGSNGPPTRHSFGTAWGPMELKGRWMTKHLGENTAAFVADEWTRFVRDTQTIRLSWGNIASYTGVIEELELARESANDIAWRMVVLVDEREQMIELPGGRTVINVTEDMSELEKLIQRTEKKIAALPEMDNNLFEQLNFMLGNLKAVTGKIDDIANTFDALESATFSTIQNMRGVLTNVQSGIAQMRLVITNTQIDAALAVRRAESDVNWWLLQTSFDVDSMNAFAILAEMDRKLELQEQGDMSKFITAQDNEDWERLAFRAGLGIDAAARLREANGVRYGERPRAGTVYLVP